MISSVPRQVSRRWTVNMDESTYDEIVAFCKDGTYPQRINGIKDYTDRHNSQGNWRRKCRYYSYDCDENILYYQTDNMLKKKQK